MARERDDAVALAVQGAEELQRAGSHGDRADEIDPARDAKLERAPAEVREGGPSHAAAPGLGPLRERHGQMAQGKTAVPGNRVPGKPTQGGAEGHGGAMG